MRQESPLSGPGLGSGRQSWWEQGEQDRREVGWSGEEEGAVGLGVTADKRNGSELELLGGVGQVITAGVWGRCWGR